jgi:hypothetical protein
VRRPTIRLLLSNGVFSQYISASEASDLVSSGRAERLKRISKKKNKSHGMAAAVTYKLLPQPEPLRSMMEASSPSITRADMLANVGITPGIGEADKGRIIRARHKIAVFGLERPVLGYKIQRRKVIAVRNAAELLQSPETRAKFNGGFVVLYHPWMADGHALHDKENHRVYVRDKANADALIEALNQAGDRLRAIEDKEFLASCGIVME